MIYIRVEKEHIGCDDKRQVENQDHHPNWSSQKKESQDKETKEGHDSISSVTHLLHYVVADLLNLMSNLLLGFANLVRNLLLGHPQVMLNLLGLLSKEAKLFSASRPQGRPLRRSEHLLLSLGHERKSSDVNLGRVVLRSCFKLFALISASRHRLRSRFLSSSPTRACTGGTRT